MPGAAAGPGGDSRAEGKTEGPAAGTQVAPRGQQGDSKGTLGGQRGDIGGTLRGRQGDTVGTARGQCGDTMGTVRGHRGDTEGTQRGQRGGVALSPVPREDFRQQLEALMEEHRRLQRQHVRAVTSCHPSVTPSPHLSPPVTLCHPASPLVTPRVASRHPMPPCVALCCPVSLPVSPLVIPCATPSVTL